MTEMEFRQHYKKQHAACPVCESLSYMSTLVVYLLDLSDKAAYEDKNKCECSKCGHKHLASERVPAPKR